MKVQTAPTRVEFIITGSIPARDNLTAEEVADELQVALLHFEGFEDAQIRITEGKTYDYK